MRGVIKCWLKDGMREEPEVLAAYCTEWMFTLLTSTEEKNGNNGI
ncbi:MAG: TetR family transcriptional regulator C-terminal domain-containing protein [Firmicutes bacterium]|nr:TetR family transcriptional regulator C-terminal domain-containing protein [Bacillota bacterium]